MDEQKKGIKHVGLDFQDIHAYRHDVNSVVLEAIVSGTFQKAKNLDEVPNLMQPLEEAKYGIIKEEVPLASDEVLKKSKIYNLASTDEKKVINLKQVHKENKQRLKKFKEKLQEMEYLERED